MTVPWKWVPDKEFNKLHHTDVHGHRAFKKRLYRKRLTADLPCDCYLEVDWGKTPEHILY